MESIKRVKMNRVTYVLLALGFLVLMSSYLVSAGIGDWWAGITGRATSGQSNATVTLSGDNHIIITILNGTLIDTTVDPSEGGTRRIEVKVNVYDADGAADINDSSIDINVSRDGELTKVNDTCQPITGESDTNQKNFSCYFDMWYFEEPGFWTITATGNDYGDKGYEKNETTFSYDTLQAIALSPSTLTWPGISPQQENVTSDNDPMKINNTGNYNIDNLTITGQTLIGVDTPSYNLDARNFTVDVETGGGGCSGVTCVECGVDAAASGAYLVNGTKIDIVGTVNNRGNLSDGSNGQEDLYYCIPYVPQNIISQQYSTTESEEWVIAIGT